MTPRWLAAQLWRHRVAGLLLTLGVTFLLLLLTTQSLQHASQYTRHRGPNFNPVEVREGTSEDDDHRPKSQPAPEPRDRANRPPPSAQAQRDPRGTTAERTRFTAPPVAFLRTHRTGSSTVQNILFRLGERESATFAFPYYTYQFSYPDKFRAEFVDELPDGSSQFDMLCSHMRLDLGQLQRLMPPNTIYITLLREPLRTFESIFSCHTSTVPAFASARKAADSSAGKKRSALSAFLEAPESFWDPEESGNGLGRNPACFDLGLNSHQWNTSWPSDLALLEEALHLVMIAEHFDESLVLLGALLKLEPEELVYVRLNARPARDVAPLDDLTMARLRSWNSLDVLLYDFFLQLFWEKAATYGLERLNNEVALLRASTERIRQRCVARAGVPPEDLEDLVRPWQTDTVTILGYRVRENLTQQEQGFCVRLVLPELQYHAHLYFQQYGRDMRARPTDRDMPPRVLHSIP